MDVIGYKRPKNNKGRQINKNFENKLQAFKFYRNQIFEKLQR